MQSILVRYPVRYDLVPEEIKRELYWYDDLKKEMQVFQGGQLKFEYQEDKFLVEMGEDERRRKGIKGTYRMIPKVVDLKLKFPERKMDKDKVKKWYDDYLNYNDDGSEIERENDEDMIFNVPDKEVGDFTFLLLRENLEYRVL